MPSLPTTGFYVSLVYFYNFEKYLATGSITLRPNSGRPGATTAAIRDFIDATMMDDDEMTSLKLQSLIWMIFGTTLSLTSINRTHRELG